MRQPVQDFYPRPPRGGRLAAALQAKVEQLFLSTPSARRATPEYQLPGCAERISIHALREEGDPHTSEEATQR